MAVHISLDVVNAKVQGNKYDMTTLTTYVPWKNLIIRKEVDGGDAWYSFIQVLVCPELRLVLFLCEYKLGITVPATWSMYMPGMSPFTVAIIRDILDLPADYVVTGDKHMFEERKGEYLRNMRQRNNAKMVALYSAFPHRDMVEKIVLQDSSVPAPVWLNVDIHAIPRIEKEDVVEYDNDGDIFVRPCIHELLSPCRSLPYTTDRGEEWRTLARGTYINMGVRY